MGILGIVVVGMLVLVVGVGAFLVFGGRGASGAPGMVALTLGVGLAVTGGIVLLRRRSGTELHRLVQDVNTSLRGVAERTGMQYIAPPDAGQTTNTADRFGEVTGTSAGIPVRIQLEPYASEDLYTTLFFPRRTLSASAVNEVRPLVNQLRNDEEGIRLYLGRSPAWSSDLGLNPLPEIDVDRVILVLDRTRQLLRAASTVAPPTPAHRP